VTATNGNDEGRSARGSTESFIGGGSELAMSVYGRSLGGLAVTCEAIMSVNGMLRGDGGAAMLQRVGDQLTRETYAAVDRAVEAHGMRRAEKTYLLAAVALNLATTVFVELDKAKFEAEVDGL
jgi:hypothetical protein